MDFIFSFMSLIHTERSMNEQIYLVASNQVFPLALALLCASMVTLFLHSC